MSILGYLRPLVQGRDTGSRPLTAPTTALAVGFTISSVLAYAILYGVGAVLPDRDVPAKVLIVGVVMALLALADTGVGALRTPMWQRQTPRDAVHAWGLTRGALVWGFDLGLGFTTFRITSLTWVGFVAALLHVVPWWSGVFYAAGYLIPSIIAVYVATPGQPAWALIDRIARSYRVVRHTATIALAIAAAAFLADAMFTF